MELEGASRRLRLVRMEDQDRVSQASSVITISSFPVQKGANDRVQTFGKGCRASKRDPNCAVVIRGWLNKKDSAGLKLWKRRWFVLSNYCLFYYKDSREECVLGSIPLPSYNILFCTPRECKNRKHTFKVVHQGMRSYFFSADTQEDMLGWVRALGQSAAMESDGSINRRCSSYQDFTQMGGSSESVDLHHSPSLGDGLSRKHRNASGTLSEPSQLTGGRMGTPHSEQRGRRSVHQSPSAETPSPPEFSRRRVRVLHQEDDALPYATGRSTPPKPAEFLGTGSLTPRGQLGSRPHTPVGRVDIRPQDDHMMMSQSLCYAPASPKLEFRSTPHTPVTERWQNLSKPAATYASVHHMPSGRRPLGKSGSPGKHTDLLPPLPPASSRATHSPHPPHHHHHHHHHHHRSRVSVCVLPPTTPPKPELREGPPVRPLESDADAVLTRLCGCDKLLQSLSIELAQLQVDKDTVHCALEMIRLQLEDWKSMQGPRAPEGALTQKALLQDELVTIRARMCDVSLEMERVWSQYERMESELSVFRSHLQHICNFGMPQDQSQAQRELWMMEDILAGLRINKENFRLLLGLQRPQIPPSVFQQTPPHPGSPGSPTEGLPSGLPMGAEQDPPARPPLPQELQESHQSRDLGHGWIDPIYEGIRTRPIDPSCRRGKGHPDLLREREHKDSFESQSSSRWTTPDATIQSTKKGKKMSEEEQMERMKRNQGRAAGRKKPPMPGPGAQTQGQSSDLQEEAPFPLRVTRVVTAVLPSSLMARRVSVEDPPPELATLLPEQIPAEVQLRLSDQSRKVLSKPPRRLLPSETSDQSWSPAETARDQPTRRLAKALQDLASERHEQGLYGPGAARQQPQQQNMTRSSSREDPWPEVFEGDTAENSRTRGRDRAGSGNGGVTSDLRSEGRPSALATPDMDPDLCLTPEQREAKLRRVERIRERVIRSAVRENARASGHQPIRRARQEVHQAPPTLINDTARQRATSDSEPCDHYGSCCDSNSGPPHYGPVELRISSGTSQDEDEGDGSMDKCHSGLGNKTQHKDYSGRKGLSRRKPTPPASPYHISSMTVYQKDGGKGFDVRRSAGQEEDLEDLSGDHGEGSALSADLRTKWFLSTNQWQGFIPLQNHGIEPLSDGETTDADRQSERHSSEADPNEISSIVSQSLEKMRENHSLFYKIACDINISDSDITRNDGNSGLPTSSKSEEGTELSTNESIPEEVTSCDVKPPDKPTQDSNEVTSPKSAKVSPENNRNGISTDDKQQDSTLTHQATQPTAPTDASSNTSTKPAGELCIYEEIPDKGVGDDNSSQENRPKVGETNPGASDQGTAPDGALDQCAKTKRNAVEGKKQRRWAKRDLQGWGKLEVCVRRTKRRS